MNFKGVLKELDSLGLFISLTSHVLTMAYPAMQLRGQIYSGETVPSRIKVSS
jgi:hypothetical protein